MVGSETVCYIEEVLLQLHEVFLQIVNNFINVSLDRI